MQRLISLSLFFTLALLSSCAIRDQERICLDSFQAATTKAVGVESDYFLIILVDARHIDTSNSQTFLQTMTKHPANGSKEGDVGHAWIYLKGRDFAIEGGHTGEYGVIRPRYADGMMQYLSQGDHNPVRYLWESLDDGIFQRGCGGHSPTYAAKFDLTQEQYESILTFIHPERYPYKKYSLTGRQCTSFVAQVAALAGIHLPTEVTMKIYPTAKISRERVRLWNDPQYASITFSSPDALEQSLIAAVRRGEAQPALAWYKKHVGEAKKEASIVDTLRKFPARYLRHLSTF